MPFSNWKQREGEAGSVRDARRPPRSALASGAGGRVARGVLAGASGGSRLSHGSGRRSLARLGRCFLSANVQRGVFVRLQRLTVS